MKITFSIEYVTCPGEELRLQSEGHEYGMTTTDGRIWSLTLTPEPEMSYRMTYRYAMYRDGNLVWTEWEVMPHKIDINPNVGTYKVRDAWRPIPEDLPLYSNAYTDHLALQEEDMDDMNAASSATSNSASVILHLRTVYPRLYAGERLAMMTSLNDWSAPVHMRHLGLHEWVASMPADQGEYKFVILNNEGKIVEWESGDNRTLPEIPISSSIVTRVIDETVPHPRIKRPDWRVAGIVIPVFSLRSDKSQGVGDFGDLCKMVRWAASAGMRAVQVLPINDTTATGTYMDSYPYNAISIYALHPMYCDISQLNPLQDDALHTEIHTEARLLNALSQVDYVAVNRLKTRYLRALYMQEGAKTMRTKKYQRFFEEMKDWLLPYAAFCYLRDKYGKATFSTWPTNAKYNKEEIEALYAGKEKKQVQFYCYVQYLLHQQLLLVRDEAARLGVILKGDIPIGISRESVEAWQEPWFFNMGSSAGAPPDGFSVNGQNWGFPTYNWDVMAEHHYDWWQRRLRHLSRYFNAYRIDHVLGFFRIWDIPIHSVHASLGQFSPALPMSQDEVRSYGLDFDFETMTRPLITDYVLNRLFGERAQMVRSRFVNRLKDGVYVMKDGYNTQCKVQSVVTDDDVLRDGLYSLISNVLFVRDRRNPELVHPCISSRDSLFYQSLRDDQKQAFDRLYYDYYYRRHNGFWYAECMKKLPALIQSTRMLVCAEDLGMVPACVPWVMNQLRILSLEIQTMPKQEGVEFGSLDDNPVYSVATISTHDMPTMRGWWQEDSQRAQRYWSDVLHHSGEAPREMPGWLADDMVWRHLVSPSMLCLLSLQDWLATDETLRHPDPDAERINLPSVSRHYWRYRMHLTIEKLEQSEAFTSHLRHVINAAGRL